MRIIVSDSSCVIGLRKASLLDAFLKLPHEILIPNTLVEDERLGFIGTQKRGQIPRGLKVIDLPGKCVERARRILLEIPHLCVHDALALVVAEANEDCIILTGDGVLHALACASKIEVRGLLWVVDQLYSNGLGSAKILREALRVLARDSSVGLPRKELAASVKRFGECC